MSSLPQNLMYTKDHEWVETSNSPSKVGVTAFAVEQLGDIVHLELPKVGSSFKSGDTFGTIESTKTVSDLYMPVSGSIIAVNEEALKKPETLQEDPYSKGWLVKVELTQKAELSKLMTSIDYEKYLRESGE